ncbi:hypothetical protein [Brucella intermedia]|uniref:hypothetical protein n=1 Tax=Brucella intermedia TaxID=94625 RepID=UPI0013AE9B85|nr:hypothetical protein [Brucella intermedia]
MAVKWSQGICVPLLDMVARLGFDGISGVAFLGENVDRHKNKYALIALGLALLAIVATAWLSQPTNQMEAGANAPNDNQRQQDDVSRIVNAINHFDPWNDTYAQWAGILVSVAAASFSAWAVFLVRDTLHETRKAVKAADDAVLATLQSGRDQCRAYVHVERAELRWGDERGRYPSCQIFVHNTGQTPAQWFEYKASIFSRELDSEGRVVRTMPFSEIDLGKADFTRWNALGPGAELSFNVGHQFISIMQNAYGREDVTLEVAGVLRYMTFFDELYESEFWFIVRPPRKYKNEKTQIPDKPYSFVIREIADKMQRVSGNLRTYRKVG